MLLKDTICKLLRLLRVFTKKRTYFWIRASVRTRLNVCLCIHLLVCVLVCVSVYVCVVCLCVYICVSMCLFGCLCACLCVCVCVSVRIYNPYCLPSCPSLRQLKTALGGEETPPVLWSLVEKIFRLDWARPWVCVFSSVFHIYGGEGSRR